MTTEALIERAAANGDGNKENFSGAPRDGQFNGIPADTTFEIPKGFVVKTAAKFSDAEYTLVNDVNVAEEAYQFFPTQLGKSYFCYTEDGEPVIDPKTGRQQILYPGGDFALAYRRCNDVGKWMREQEGKKVKYTTDGEKVWIKKFNGRGYKEVTVPNYNYVG